MPQHRLVVSRTDFTTKLLRQFDNVTKTTTLGTREDLRLNKRWAKWGERVGCCAFFVHCLVGVFSHLVLSPLGLHSRIVGKRPVTGAGTAGTKGKKAG